MELFEIVTDLVRREGVAALIVSHHLNIAARFSDRLVLLADGRVLADGPAASVLTAERLSTVFDWPVGVQLLADGTPQLHPERRPVAAAGDAP